MEDQLFQIIIVIVTVCPVVVTLAYNAQQIKQSKNATYAKILTQTMKDLHELYQNEEKLKTKHECEVYVVRWLDCLSIVTNLYNRGKIEKELLNFIEYDLSVAKRLMIWFDEHNLGKKYDSDANHIWSNLKLYFENNSLNAANEEILPIPLKNFNDLT